MDELGKHWTERQGIWGSSPALSLGCYVTVGESGCPGGERRGI